MAQIINLTATTELEAVNAMLSAIGEQPVTDTASTLPQVVNACNILRNITREVQLYGWQFNTEFGFPLTPTATIAWTDPAGTKNPVTSINVWTSPKRGNASLGRAFITATDLQGGLDMTLVPSRVYTDAQGKYPIIFYDRSNNRDGLDSTKFPTLYIDAIWLYDYEQMHEAARAYAMVKAARQFAQDNVGSVERAGFKQADEMAAWAQLCRLQAPEDTYNLYDELTTQRMLGMRPRFAGWPDGVIDIRYNP